MPDLSNIRPVKRENLPEIVYERLCQLILEGGLEPGQAVTVATLSEALDVSPMPIREAMARLSHIGALTKISGRSVGVPSATYDELVCLRDARLAVEEEAVRKAIGNTTKEFESSLHALLVEMIQAEETHDNLRFINLNYRFHFSIYSQSDNPVLVEIIRNLWLRISPNFHILNVRGHLKISNKLHTEMLAAIENRDSPTACRCLRDDINRAHDQLITCLGSDLRKTSS